MTVSFDQSKILSEKTENRISYDPTWKLVPDLCKLQDQVRHGEIDWVGLSTWQAAVKSHGEVVSYDSNASYEASRRLDTSTTLLPQYGKIEEVLHIIPGKTRVY
jgi:hypothetical protein